VLVLILNLSKGA